MRQTTSKEEYVEKMKELGWGVEQLAKIIQAHDAAAKEGIIIPFSIFSPDNDSIDCSFPVSYDAYLEMKTRRK